MMCRIMCAAWLDSARDAILRHRRIINLRNVNAPAPCVLLDCAGGKIGATPHAPPSHTRKSPKNFRASKQL